MEAIDVRRWSLYGRYSMYRDGHSRDLASGMEVVTAWKLFIVSNSYSKALVTV